MVVEIECVAALDTEKLAIDAGVIAIVTANNLVIADAEGGFTAGRTMRADGSDVLHFPGAGFRSIGAAGPRANGGDIATHAAPVAHQIIPLVRGDFRDSSPVDDTERART